MTKRARLAIAIVLGLLAALFGMLYLNTERDKFIGSSEVVHVYVATEDIPANTIIDKDKLTTRAVPRSFLQPQSITTTEIPDKANVKGVTIVEIKQNEQLLRTKLWDGTEPPLSKDLKSRKGMVAVTVAMKAQPQALHGLVKPGNRVDVLASFRFEKSDKEDFREVRPLLTDVEILAVNDTSISNVKPYVPVKAGDERVAKRAETVTMALPPAAAQQVILAQQLGDIWLLLRAEGDNTPHTYEVWNNERLLQSQYKLWRSDPREEMMSQLGKK
jgi:Flp pilus assembly protein CpaB